ncbi:UNVERIFIED_CONTAM: hypothetical protein HDU68_000863 [Siphonaria sp. JEL0065]|nr:hypothetical protein HDU68_000863 [Siphonaria sp. JEL0065]
MTKSDDKIILYTNHGCPWAHRAHIVLAELGLPFEEVIIDLSIPRDQRTEYLKINPRGIVPTISWNGEIIPESAIVSQFLADAYPSHLVEPSNTPQGALQRAKINVFVDAFFSKFQSELFKIWGAKTDADALPFFEAAVNALALEIEPRLGELTEDKPYFGASEKLTLVEVLTGSFLVRIVSLLKAGVYPQVFADQLQSKTPRFWKWAQVVSAHPSVTGIFDEEKIVAYTKVRLEKARSG